MKKLLFYYICIVLVFVSCSKKKKEPRTTNNNLVELQREEMNFLPSDVLQLKSYYLSSPVETDSVHILVGYNYKEHALDCMDLLNKKISQIPLQIEGPNAITRLTGIFAYKKDSIWISDESESVFLVNHEGLTMKRIHVRDYLQEEEELIINTNHAMSTIHLYYNAAHQSLLCTVKDRSTSPVRFKVKEIFIEENKEAKTFDLLPSVVEPDISKGYANMSEPNVNFRDGYILYNYPIESHLYRANLTTGISEIYPADSEYTTNQAEKCKSKTDYSEWEKHGFENPHFFDLMYIPRYDMYARLHIGPIDFKEDENPEIIAHKRDLYLCLFDNKFNKIKEAKLPSNTFSPYTGWSQTDSGILLFVDKITDQDNSEDLELNIFHPIFINL
ncbi:DUF4221 domain-containing protein [Parabacteroides sp. AF48-14]|uniref:DUF4221 family protein n=1 Tax=Parabacteroides sp. AF48-14 TaxID=2292052 RepID=UPI000F000BAD|nr:DUF4221 family protein [Parabacteroides sp. AF48-14]RHO70254.1 DUF4221 domain-containing protein [Parabacteroides sp. AF48-14]